MIETGRIVHAHSNLYTVDLGGQSFRCKLRGRFRLEGLRVAVGDVVRLSIIGDGEGVIEDILPRQTHLERPLVANVDQTVITITASSPPLDLMLVDRLLIVTRRAGTAPVICLNKADQLDPEEAEAILAPYRAAGVPAFAVSAKLDMGIEPLREQLRDHISVFAGLSGVGKSSIANALLPGVTLQTGELSLKLGRGKHTTRNVQLLALPAGGFIVDTPGFTVLELTGMLHEDVKRYYPDFAEYEAECRFADCMHLREPVCGVKQALEDGVLDAGRYARYLTILAEVTATERRY